MKLFLDTNVLIDWFLQRGKGYAAANSLLALAEMGTVKAYATSMSIVTANYICCERNNLLPIDWEAKLQAIEPFLNICPVFKRDIYQALTLHWRDYEDAVQYCAARQTACDLLVTRNTKDFQLSTIAVKDPEETLDIILSEQ